MKNNNLLIYSAICAILFLGGCQKYIDIKTQGSLVPGSYSNYRYLLNDVYDFESVVPAISDYASDDVQLIDSSSQQMSLANSDSYGYWVNSYKWSSVIYPANGSYAVDHCWNNMYNCITYSNVIVQEVPAVTDASEAAKNELIAEALVHRADAYLDLINTYAKPYNANTSSLDLGVPLVLTETTSQSLIRASVQDVYAQIISDLKRSVAYLPDSQSINTLPSKPSAFGELARCYLYMNLYDSAKQYADSALAYRSQLIDLSNLTSLSTANYPTRFHNPEILLSKVVGYYGTSSYSPYAMRLSDTLLSLLDKHDQRYNLFTTDYYHIFYSNGDTTSRYFYKDGALGESRNAGPTVAEMMLIKAEYYARNGDVTNAMKWVNTIRKSRMQTGYYTALTANGASDALTKVIQERNREFFCRMLRWWDMRRLKNDPLFSHTVTRRFNGQTYTLDPNSNRYVFPIAQYNISLNPEIQQNP